MQLPQIRLTSNMAQIAIKATDGKQEIHQPKASLSIEQPHAEISMQSRLAKLTIDQTQAWEEMNLMSTSKQIQKFAQEGLFAVLEGMERRAQQGLDLMKIEEKGNPIIEQAMMNGHKQMKSISMKYIPSPFSVKFNVEPSQLHINTVINKPIIHATIRQPEHHYERGSVNVYMQQYEELEVDFVNLFSVSI